MIFVGIDWAEAHHDVVAKDSSGVTLVKSRIPEGIEGLRQFHELVAPLVDDPSDVIVGIETDRSLLVEALICSGYQVYAINPYSASRYRDRYVTSGAKSDPGDASVLAEVVRSDRHMHRKVAGDSEQVEAIKVLARGHQSLIWSRQSQVNKLRSMLREFYPGALAIFGSDLDTSDALSVFMIAPTPELGRTLSVSKISSALRRGGRIRRVDERAKAIQAALRAPQLGAPLAVSEACGVIILSIAKVIAELNSQIITLEQNMTKYFMKHPDAEIILSMPGLRIVLGARVLGEFGDDPNRYKDSKSRKNYAGTSPITKASGTKRIVLARYARNKRLADALYLWSFGAIRVSPGARGLYDKQRAGGASHNQALRAVANKLVGILHGCLRTQTPYNENLAWGCEKENPSAA
ncbi:MAG: IS110 family transposase [Candidatus Marsarchaeota archaeon]|nr:IS110 family transposase [Candidatus Marsarchaeota archaeon]